MVNSSKLESPLPQVSQMSKLTIDDVGLIPMVVTVYVCPQILVNAAHSATMFALV